ncbi:spermidine/putrescine ABC transporter substrate-binding protein [Anaerotalea alkaliphila]|uniref:polyamine ABC transporter substrate-binding protein n=1 Tax=Anaerotalea alkaliphila TaxID=2662126 RepID=UPI0031B6510D
MRMRKTAALAAFLLAMGLALGGCGKKEASNELNLFNWSEYLPQELIEKFEEETGVRVNYNTYSSNEEMLAKIMTAPGMYDIAVSTDYMVDIMIQQKLLEEIGLEGIEGVENLGANYLDLAFDPGNRYSLPYMAGTALLAVNTSKVDFDIEEYADLWNPALENSIVVLDDQRAVMGLALKKLGKSINETDPGVLEAAARELAALKPNIKAFDSDSPKSLLISGEVSVGYVWNAEAVMAQKENPDIKIVMPEEGLYLWQDNFVIPKGAPNAENARKFISFMLRPENSKICSDSFPYTNPNAAALELIDEETRNNPGIYPDDSVYAQGEFLVDVGETTVVYDKIWTDFKQQ